MTDPIKVIQLSAEGVTQSFIAKGSVAPEVMRKACQEQFIPSEYEDSGINVDNSKVVQGNYRWIPAKSEDGEFCGSRLISTDAAGQGSFFGTELILCCSGGI